MVLKDRATIGGYMVLRERELLLEVMWYSQIGAV